MDVATLRRVQPLINKTVIDYERQIKGLDKPLHPSRYGMKAKTMYFKMDAGRFNFKWTNPNGRLWTFPAGTVDYNTGEPITTSTAEQPNVIIPDGGGVVSLTSDSWKGYSLTRVAISSGFIGDLADIPLLTGSLNLANCSSITGNLADAPPVKSFNANKCFLLTGDIIDLPSSINSELYLDNCSLITGNLNNLHNIKAALQLQNTKVTGAYTNVSGNNVPSVWLSNTQISAEDMDATLIAFAQCTKTGGTFSASGMTRTAASDQAVAHLTTPVAEGGLGWTVSGLTKV